MQKIVPKLLAITPTEMYLQRANAIYEAIRKEQEGLDYTPAQFGGIFGQQAVLENSTVLEITVYEIT